MAVRSERVSWSRSVPVRYQADVAVTGGVGQSDMTPRSERIGDQEAAA